MKRALTLLFGLSSSLLLGAQCPSSAGNQGGVEDCRDRVDNDEDGDIDCADSECAVSPACPLLGGGSGEGEGEGPGEGEGEGPGEGEGEGPGEGEGEGPGEGEGETAPDDVGNRSNPAPVNLPFEIEHDLEALGDVDCFTFSTHVVGTVAFEVTGATGACPGDVELSLFGEDGLVAEESGTGCALLFADVDAGEHTVCVNEVGANAEVLGLALLGELFAGLLISEVADPEDPSLGTARFVELFNITSVDAAADNYALRVYANGSNTPGLSTPLSSGGIIPAGGTYVVARDQVQLAASFGVQADQQSGNINANGDDAYELATAGVPAVPIDVYGVIGVDGTTEPWLYEDRGARRNAGVDEPSTSFDLSQWTLSTGFSPGDR